MFRRSLMAAVTSLDAHRLFASERWIEVALRLLPLDAFCACDLLRLNDSQRANDELDGILERATILNEDVAAALSILERGSPSLDADEKRPRYIAALAKLLASPAAEGIENGGLAFAVTLAADELAATPVVIGSARAREHIAACQRERPLS
jgi:hypothetical protein